MRGRLARWWVMNNVYFKFQLYRSEAPWPSPPKRMTISEQVKANAEYKKQAMDRDTSPEKTVLWAYRVVDPVFMDVVMRVACDNWVEGERLPRDEHFERMRRVVTAVGAEVRPPSGGGEVS